MSNLNCLALTVTGVECPGMLMMIVGLVDIQGTVTLAMLDQASVYLVMQGTRSMVRACALDAPWAHTPMDLRYVCFASCLTVSDGCRSALSWYHGDVCVVSQQCRCCHGQLCHM